MWLISLLYTDFIIFLFFFFLIFATISLTFSVCKNILFLAVIYKDYVQWNMRNTRPVAPQVADKSHLGRKGDVTFIDKKIFIFWLIHGFWSVWMKAWSRLCALSVWSGVPDITTFPSLFRGLGSCTSTFAPEIWFHESKW